MPIPYIIGGGAVALAARKRKRMAQAASNKYSQKYPLLDNCSSMEASLKSAQIELKNLSNAPASTASAKRQKKYAEAALSSWISTIKSHNNDLKCGLDLSSVQSVAPISQVIPAVNSQVTAQEIAPSETQNLASDTRKKGVNWILIGGVLVAGVVIFKLLKKK